MAEEPSATRREKVLRIGEHAIPIREPVPVETVVADAVSELRLVGRDNVALSLVTLCIEGGEAEARVCARLRISLETVADIQRGLADILDRQARQKASAN